VAAAGPLNDFGFWDAGKKNSGTYFIDILTPDNGGSSSAPSGAYAITGAVSGTAALFSSTAWTSGKLDNYLGIQASPSNPLAAWLHATQSLDSKAMGYWVFQADLGSTALGTSSGTGPLLKLSSTLPPGSVVVAFLETNTSHPKGSSHESGASDETANSDDNGNENDDDNGENNDQDNGQGSDHDNGKNNDHGKGKNSNSFTATADSSALFETSPTIPNGHGVPEPGTVALLMAALLGFGMRLLPWRAASRLTVLSSERLGR
jgi:hypothetical protein